MTNRYRWRFASDAVRAELGETPETMLETGDEVKSNPVRRVVRAGGYFLKCDRRGAGRFRREWRGAELLRESGIPVVEYLACGDSPNGGCLITRALPESESVGAYYWRKFVRGGENPDSSTENAESGKKKPRVVYLSPQGDVFSQKMAEEFAAEEDLILLCGHYEGIDERVLEEIVTDYVSIGDYVLTGGELPAMVMVDAISRLVPGVLHNDVSAEFESFQDNLLEYPQYSRPEEWHGKKVPPVLLSGHHANIEKWRREQYIISTYERRPDLLEKSELTDTERRWLEETIKKDDNRA